MTPSSRTLHDLTICGPEYRSPWRRRTRKTSIESANARVQTELFYRLIFNFTFQRGQRNGAAQNTLCLFRGAFPTQQTGKPSGLQVLKTGKAPNATRLTPLAALGLRKVVDFSFTDTRFEPYVERYLDNPNPSENCIMGVPRPAFSRAVCSLPAPRHTLLFGQ